MTRPVRVDGPGHRSHAKQSRVSGLAKGDRSFEERKKSVVGRLAVLGRGRPISGIIPAWRVRPDTACWVPPVRPDTACWVPPVRLARPETACWVPPGRPRPDTACWVPPVRPDTACWVPPVRLARPD